MELVELYCILDCRFVEHCESRTHIPRALRLSNTMHAEYMDDFILNDRRWSFMVAIVDLCLGWIFYRRHLRLPYRSHRCCIPHFISSHCESILWHLGLILARDQPCSNGHHLVRGPGLHWRYGYLSFWCRVETLEDSFSVLGECVTLMIRAIWPSYNDLPNTIPASAGVTTQGFVSFFLFWLCSLPALWFPVHQVRHLFTVKAIYSPIAAIAFFAWAISRANGIGPIVHQPNTVHGSDLSWAVIKGIMSCIGNFAALIMNDPDFSRFARTPKDALWSQLLTIPIGFGITSFIGIIVSSSAEVIFGKLVWNPLDLLGLFLDGASSAQRFGIFIIALGFTLAQLGTNISANSVSAGTDLTALLPRYLNIRRGSYICAAISLAMCPVGKTSILFSYRSRN